MYEITIECESSLISHFTWNEDKELTFYFRKYYTDKITYKDVLYQMVEELQLAPSVGKFYLQYIKPYFKQKTNNAMADVLTNVRGEGWNKINKASSEVRYLDASISVGKGLINKDWLRTLENGDIMLDLKIRLMPDGTVDKYGNLAMISQKVPKFITDAEKDLPNEQKSRGNILGNACEFEPKPKVTSGAGSTDGTYGASKADQAWKDDLPF